VSLTCREFVQFLDDYLAGELEPETKARFERHLAACPSCTVYTETYRASIRLARQAFQSDTPVTGVPEALVEAILRARDYSRAS
jgi:anti-sigma factor RsiW